MRRNVKLSALACAALTVGCGSTSWPTEDDCAFEAAPDAGAPVSVGRYDSKDYDICSWQIMDVEGHIVRLPIACDGREEHGDPPIAADPGASTDINSR